jgi:uncharacterized protein (DUF433 family)
MASHAPTPAVVEQNPIEVPLYTALDVARYLHAPLWIVLALSGHGRYPPHPKEWFHFFGPDPGGLLLADDDLLDRDRTGSGERFSFARLAEFFVRAAALEAVAELVRAERRSRGWWVDWSEALWAAVHPHEEAGTILGGPAARQKAAIDRFLQPFARLLTPGEQDWLRKLVSRRLERVELQADAPVRLYPSTRPAGQDSPRAVVLDPLIRFGRPTVAGRGTPTDILFGRYQAGDSLALLGDDYGIPLEEIEEAIRYEATPPVPLAFLPPLFIW